MTPIFDCFIYKIYSMPKYELEEQIIDVMQIKFQPKWKQYFVSLYGNNEEEFLKKYNNNRK